MLEGDVVGVLPVGVVAELELLGRREVFFPFLVVSDFFFLGVLVVLLGLVVVGVVVAGVVVAGEDICAFTAGAVRATGAATTRDRSKAFAILVM
ncbi:hypothetical protein [Brasilonema bromeliae]|uniref:hypothetical protein n=1 Tax=Brasilonema bromeliae TaxID=383615 RepID=UPI0030D8BD74